MLFGDLVLSIIKAQVIKWSLKMCIGVLALWILASFYDTKYISVVVCFVAFFVNDIYGYISWQKIKKRQLQNKFI